MIRDLRDCCEKLSSFFYWKSFKSTPHFWEYTGICIRTHCPLFREEDSWTRLLTTTYVPLSKIKPSRSSVGCRECFYSFAAASIFASVAVTVARLTASSGFFSYVWVEALGSKTLWFSVSMSVTWLDDSGSPSSKFFSADGWFFFARFGFTIAVVVTCLSLCSVRKQSRNCFWQPQIAAIPFGVGNFMRRWYVDRTAFMAFSQGVPLITL